MDTFPIPAVNSDDLIRGFVLLAPVLVVVLTAITIIVLDLIPPDWVSRRPLMWVGAAGVLVAFAVCAALALTVPPNDTGSFVGQSAFGGFLVFDGFALFFQVLFLLAALLVILSFSTFADRERQIESEFYAITLFATAGLMLMAAGNELISIYLALELSSLSLAFLATWNKRDRLAHQGLLSGEAGIKFLLLSAMSTAMLLFGLALLYGITGVTTLADIAGVISQQPTPAVLLSVTMIVAGFGFKIAAAPFQLWTPDVYQGAPTPATAFFSVASKAAGFAVLLRIFYGALPAIAPEWTALFGVLAFVTMTVGNLMAIVQTNIKRMMAYSSIAHVGYMLIGLATASVVGSSAVMYYLLAYTLTNLAAFTVIGIMAQYVPDDTIAGYAGLARRSPAMGLALTAALLSLAGIPPFIGFFSKLYLFLAAIQRESLALQLLVMWALIMSAVSLYYYGRVIYTMWMRDSTQAATVRPAFSQGLALGASVLGVVAFGVLASPFLTASLGAASTLTR